MNNFVSVLLPVYNGEKFLEKSIKSVLKQTFTNFELLIYNDGSTDSTATIISLFDDDRIQLFESHENKGIVHALNFLIDKARGFLIARIDADDVWYPNKLEKQIHFINSHREIVLVGCFARLIDDKGLEFKTKFKQYSDYNEIRKYLLNSNFIIHSSVLIRKRLFNYIGKYREKYLHTEDYDLWLRVLYSNLRFLILPEVLLDYRVSLFSVNFRFRKIQSKNVIRLKFHYWRQYGFRLFYLKELFRNFYYLFFPYWILTLKRKIFNNDQSLKIF